MGKANTKDRNGRYKYGAIRTITEVAAIMGCTHQNITRIEKNALRKLYKALKEYL